MQAWHLADFPWQSLLSHWVLKKAAGPLAPQVSKHLRFLAAGAGKLA